MGTHNQGSLGNLVIPLALSIGVITSVALASLRILQMSSLVRHLIQLERIKVSDWKMRRKYLKKDVYRLLIHWCITIHFHPFLVDVGTVSDWLRHAGGIHAPLSVPFVLRGHAGMEIIRARRHLRLSMYMCLLLLRLRLRLSLLLLLLLLLRRGRRCLLVVMVARTRCASSRPLRCRVFPWHYID